MFRAIFSLKCLASVALLSLAACQGQTLSGCRASPPMSPHVKPGVAGLSVSRRRMDDGRI